MNVKLVIIAVFLFAAAFVSWSFLYPKFSDVQDLRSDIDLYTLAREDVESKVSGIQNEIRKFENLKKEDLDLLYKILPNDEDLANLYVHINFLVSSSGLITKDIVISEGAKFTGGTWSDMEESAEEESKAEKLDFGKVSVQVEAEGSYESLKEFLKKSEHTLRIMDVKSISLGFGESAARYSFSIGASVYYK